MPDMNDLIQNRNKIVEKMEALVTTADAENRNMTADELKEFDGFKADVEALDGTIAAKRGLGTLKQTTHADPPPPAEPPDAGLSDSEIREYSLLKAVRAAANNDWRDAGLEQEASRAVAEKLNREPRGFFVPNEYMLRADGQPIEHRAVTKGLTGHTGENIIAEDYRGESFIELLRNKMVVRSAGARVVSGLVGEFAIPKILTGATAGWIAEDGDAPESTPTFGQVTMSPKTIAGLTQVTRTMLLQSSPDVEKILRDDLTGAIAMGMDYAGLHGPGTGNAPTGIANVTGVGLVSIGANGGPLAWSHIVDLETEVAVDNADVGNLSYISNAKVRGALKQTEKASGTAKYLWENGAHPLNGYACHVTNQVRSDLTKGTGTNLSAAFFGNWADLFIGLWGVLDVLVDPYTQGAKGRVRIIAFQSSDLAVRHAESFAVVLDATT